MFEDSAGVAVAPSPITAVDQAIVEQRLRCESQLKSAAGWFFTIAVLSFVNSIILAFGGTWHFIIGLGITTFFDAVALGLKSSVANIAVFIINTFILAIPVTFGVFGRKGHKWAFIVGMILYALDGLILIAFQDWLGVAFHAYALFMIYKGVAAANELKQMQQQILATTPVPIQP